MTGKSDPQSFTSTSPKGTQGGGLGVNLPVFLASGLGILAIAIWAIAVPGQAEELLGATTAWISVNLGWWYIGLATAVVVFVVLLAASRFGAVRLGPDHSRPQYPWYSWGAMLFAAGIGVDLLFFAVAEPVAQYYGPPTGDGQSIEAARQAVVLTMFHYGITGWAMYALMGMCFAYFAYRQGLPLTIRAVLYPIVGKRVHGAVGHSVEIAAMLGTVFGVATSLGIGVVQLNYGLWLLFGVSESLASQIALIALAVVVATISAVSGVDKGIKRLSELNVGLAICLLTYILVTGHTAFLFDALIGNVGDYVTGFLGLSMETYAFNDANEWLGLWTLFFWAWWVAWAPFVGLFLARISRGRSIRQFVAGTLIVPFLFITTWISIFGNSALQIVMSGNHEFGEIAVASPERAFYQLLEQYPAATAVAIVASIIGLLLYITSADSSALVMSTFTSKVDAAHRDGPKWSRIFWAFTTGLLTIAMLFVNGIPTLLNATVLIGLPFSVVLVLAMWGLWRALQDEKARSAARLAATGPLGVERSFSQRLSYAITYPDAKTYRAFITDTGAPALREVAADFRDLNGDPQVEVVVEETTITHPLGETTIATLPAVRLSVAMSGGDFVYALTPVARPIPAYHFDVKTIAKLYYRCEVYGPTGSLGYDVIGASRRQVMSDVATRFEEHVQYLELAELRESGRKASLREHARKLREKLRERTRALRNDSPVQ